MHECIVIGGGPGGLVATKELLEAGVDDVVCLEQASGPGGAFRRSYDGLRLTSSVTFSMFSDFRVGDGSAHRFWSGAEAVEYWRRYAQHYGVLGRLRTDATVTRVEDDGEAWSVTLAGGDRLRARRLALAVGNNSVPREPVWAGEVDRVTRIHVHDYRHPDPFRGQRVLVVGGGESGSDVALEIAAVANRVWVSLRRSAGWIVPRCRGPMAADIATHRGVWGLPRRYGQFLTRAIIDLERGREDPVFDVVAELNERIPSRLGIWGTYGTKTLALPRAVAEHGAEVVGEVVRVRDGGRRLDTEGGGELVDVDAIVFCTGYRNHVDFMPESLRTCDPRALYKHVFHPDLGDRIGWIGWARPNFGSQFPIMEMQARLFALVAAGRHRLPPADDLRCVAARDRERWIEQFEDSGHQIRSLVDYHRYMDDLAEVIGCTPPLARYFFTRPRLWLSMVFGPQQGTQYRLRGPGRKTELAHEILRSLPVSRLNHVVRLGLRGRLRYPASLVRSSARGEWSR